MTWCHCLSVLHGKITDFLQSSALWPCNENDKKQHLCEVFIYLKNLMQIKSYLGFVKPNSTQHFTFSTALSAAQDLTINLLEFLHHALQNVTFGLLSYPCVITYIAELMYPFSTCIFTLLKKNPNAEQTPNSLMMQGEECPATSVCLRHSFVPAFSGTVHMEMWDLFLPKPQ